MSEIERNPLAMRQGAAAVACIAAAAVAMPVIAHRAAEQRDEAAWAVRSSAFHAELRQHLLDASDPTAQIELTALRAADGLRARGAASLPGHAPDTHAMLIEAVLRGPIAAGAPAPRAKDTLDPRELRCMSEAVYYEARGETVQGQLAVAEVVMNRVGSKHYPRSVCGVVYQGSHRATGCQFTFTCDGSLAHRPRGRAWERAQNLATQVMLGYTRPMTRRATHYHTRAVKPRWSAMLVETAAIGSHVFYRFPNRTERAVLMEAAARRTGAAGAPDAPEALIPEAAEAAAAPAHEEAAPALPDAPAPEQAPAQAPAELAT